MRRRWTLMHGIARAKHAWSDYVREISQAEGIPDSYRQVIMFLHRNPGSSQRGIAEFVGVTTSAINQVVKSMQEERYLRKEADPSDRRSCRLYLTETGEDAADRLHRKLDEADERITAFIGAQREDELTELLHQLSDFIRKELGQC